MNGARRMLSGRRHGSHRMFSGRRHGGLLLLSVLICLALGCDTDPPRLYCGAGIQPPVAELTEQFSRRHGMTIECDYAGSEVLLSRVKLTGQGDLYMPGDAYYIELAEKEGLIAFRKTVCYFVPVILVQKGNPRNIHTLADLTRPEVKVGLGDPEVCAIGRQSSRIFEKNGISEDDINVEFRSVTVNDLGTHVKLGTLDAAIVWDAVAAFAPEQTEAIAIPRGQNVISTVAIGVLKSSEHPDLAEKFVEFVTSERGKAVFRKHHYTTTLPE